MTGLWTNDRDTLDQGVAAWLAAGYEAEAAGDYLVNTDVVRVLDPDDDELVEHGARAMYESYSVGLPWEPLSEYEKDKWRDKTRAVIEALRQP